MSLGEAVSASPAYLCKDIKDNAGEIIVGRVSCQAAGSVRWTGSVGWFHYQAGLRPVSGAVSPGGALGLNITPLHCTGQSTHQATVQSTGHTALT